MTVYKKKSGEWYVDISGGVSPITGKRKRHQKTGFSSRREAEDYQDYYRVTKLHEENTKIIISVFMLFEIMDREDVASSKKKTTLSGQRSDFGKYFSNYFDVADMSKMTYDDVIEFREYLQTCTKVNGELLSNRTINKQIILLKKLLDVACRKGWLSSNPCRLVKQLPQVRKNIDYYTVEELKRFLALFNEKEYVYQLLFKTLFFSGLRIGECLALTWNDVDFDKGFLDVNKSLFTFRGENIYQVPKTINSIRRVYLPSFLLKELSVWKVNQLEILKNFCKTNGDLQVFQNSPEITTKDMVERSKRKVVRRDKSLKVIRIHDFRHSHAALLISQGESLYMIKDRLGHADIQTTSNTYGHLYPSKQQELAQRLEGFF